MVFGKAASVLPRQRCKTSNVCLRYMHLKPADAVWSAGYVWMSAVQFLVSVQASAAKPISQNPPGLPVCEGLCLGVTQNWSCCRCEALVRSVVRRGGWLWTCCYVVRCQAQRWVLRLLKHAGCWSWGEQESWPRAHPSAGCSREGSASPAKEQLNSPVPEPWFMLGPQVALKENKGISSSCSKILQCNFLSGFQ